MSDTFELDGKVNIVPLAWFQGRYPASRYPDVSCRLGLNSSYGKQERTKTRSQEAEETENQVTF
jgi:hypothetical protein